VIMKPLRAEWSEARQTVESLLTTGKKGRKSEVRDQKSTDQTEGPVGAALASARRQGGREVRPYRENPLAPAALRKARGEAASLVHQFLTRLQTVKVLDPACGSGNFLYVTLLKLKDLEKAAILYAMDNGLGGFLPMVGPWQLHGIEINPYAHDLAQMTVWIGWLQWIKFNGFGQPQEPILRPMGANFRCGDAILSAECGVRNAESECREPEWPKVDVIVGNPPFLGDKMMRRELGDEYVDRLRALYAGRIPGQSDLCCYWFEKARAQIEKGLCKRAGLLATQGIRGGANREVLKRIKRTGDIFWAVSDRDWVLDGANVHVSMVGFDQGTQTERTLDGSAVDTIQANLTANQGDHGAAARIGMNAGVGFVGVAQKAPFDISDARAIEWLRTPNPNGKPNSDVLRPIVNAVDITRRYRWTWNIDFGLDIPEQMAAQYEAPFEHIRNTVRPLRVAHREARQTRYWWLFARPCPDMRKALGTVSRHLATPRVSKHRVFVWLPPELLCDSALVVFARSDDFFLGLLQSRVHEVWALRLGTRLETRPRYTPTTCFETFPFPPNLEPGTLNHEPGTKNHELLAAIAAAARDLNALRETWLNPPEWVREEVLEFPGTVGGPWTRYILNPEPRPLAPGAIAPVRYPRLVPRDSDCAAKLAKRTLTALYNQRPAWLADAHRRLDEAVFAAYGWEAGMAEGSILGGLLALNARHCGRKS